MIVIARATARGALDLKHWRKYKIVMREILMIESKQIQSDQCDISAQKQRLVAAAS